MPTKEAIVLQLLSREAREMYGLELVKLSRGRLKPGTVYVILDRLEAKGLIASRVEKRDPTRPGIPRRLYRLRA